MKAVRYHQFGGPEVLRYEEIPDPQVSPESLLIKVKAAGVNFSDLMRRQGSYTSRDPLPAQLGLEAAGTVAAMGARVKGFKKGGVDRVLECVGGEVLTKSVKALAPGGKLVVYGRASGSLPSLNAEELLSRNLQIVGLHIGMPPWSPLEHKAALDEILKLVAAKKVRPVVDRTFPMKDVAQAHDYLAQRKTMGKVLLVP